MNAPGRVLRVTLSGHRVEFEEISCPDAIAREGGQEPGLGALPEAADPPGALVPAALGGSALAVACVAAEVERGRAQELLVLAVGEGVARRLPTAARAVVAGVAPLGGRYAEGQVGGELAAALSSLGAGLVVRGRLEDSGRVLIVGPGGARLIESPLPPETAPGTLLEELARVCPGSAAICVGPAAHAGVPYASLASGGRQPSFVGRGGLGLRLARLGLGAIVVEPNPQARPRVAAAAGAELAAALLRSPRLAARAEGGTLELLQAFAARGDLGRADGAAAPSGLAADLAGQVHASRSERHGCRGCPTPCGLAFSRAGHSDQRARFGASDALGTRLGFRDFSKALGLLARCDELGLDAKEMGAALGVYAALCDSGVLEDSAGWGDEALLVERIDATLRHEAAGALLFEGTAALSARFGAVAPVARGQAVRPVSDLASLLGQCVSSAGGDPMRSFPFSAQGGSIELLRELAPELDLTAAAADPTSPEGKGRLVAWHEDLAAALDTLGFCAFSGAGLLADRVMDLDEFARAVGGPLLGGSESPGAALVGLGRSVVEARRAVDIALGCFDEHEVPFAEDRLKLPGMRDGYLDWRAQGSAGRAANRKHAADGEPERAAGNPPTPTPPARSEPRASSSSAVHEQAPIEVVVRCSGPLAELLGADRRESWSAAPTLTELLQRLSADHRQAGALLLSGGVPIVGAWTAGRCLRAHERLADGDQVELVGVIAGG